jgi:hypothetical protein
MRYAPAENNPLQTKQDVELLLGDLWRPLEPVIYDPKLPAPRLGLHSQHEISATQFEAFSRPLWGLVGTSDRQLANWPDLRTRILEGTDPKHPNYWGGFKDFDHKFVDLPALACALYFQRALLWDPLPSAGRTLVQEWLSSINHYRLHVNNWLWFRVIVNSVLANLTETEYPPIVANDLAQIETLHVGMGWYADGKRETRDYYTPTAFHFYGLLYITLRGTECRWSEIAAQRAKDFAPQYASWFSDAGDMVPFGRSLSYRFGHLSFWAALGFANVEALPWGTVRTLYLNGLKRWTKRPIFTETGLLNVGYAYENNIHVEAYICSASPYWAFKAFLSVGIADHHPFWTEAPRTRSRESVHVQPEAKAILVRDVVHDHVFALSANSVNGAGIRYATEKYHKFAYSSFFGFSVPIGSLEPANGGADSTLLFSIDGKSWKGRDQATNVVWCANGLQMDWSPWRDIRVRTWLIPCAGNQLRLHWVKTKSAVHTCEGGFAVPRSPTNQDVQTQGPACSSVLNPVASCAITDLLGLRQGLVSQVEVNTNLVHPRTLLPLLHGIHPAGEHWLITYVETFAPLESKNDIPIVVVSRSDSAAEVTFSGEKIMTCQPARFA